MAINFTVDGFIDLNNNGTEIQVLVSNIGAIQDVSNIASVIGTTELLIFGKYFLVDQTIPEINTLVEALDTQQN